MSIEKKTLVFPLVAWAASLCIVTGAHADVPVARDSRIPTPAELTLLPPYCPYTQIISKRYGGQQSATKYDAAAKPFVDLYGSDFWHLHHYCFGLVDVLRAASKPSDRQRLLNNSIFQYEYVMRGVSPNSILLPELHMQKGISLIQLKRGAEAVLELKKAIELNPRFVRAYIELSDYYVDSKRNDLARQVLEDGLRVSPDTASLQKRYSKLGGTKTFARTEPSPPVMTPEPAPVREAMQPEQAQQGESPQTEEKIGTPTNPYCRFCP